METYSREMVKEFGRTRTRLLMSGSFSELLNHDLRQSDKSITELSKIFGVSRASLHKWKSGEVFPAVDVLARIADYIFPEVADTVIVQYVRKIQEEKIK